MCPLYGCFYVIFQAKKIPPPFLAEPAAHHDVCKKKSFEVTEFYADHRSLVTYYPRGFTKPDFNEGPKLYEENMQLCMNIIKNLDDLDAKKSRGQAVKCQE